MMLSTWPVVNILKCFINKKEGREGGREDCGKGEHIKWQKGQILYYENMLDYCIWRRYKDENIKTL